MNEAEARAAAKCLEIDVDFYRELYVFLMKKHTKILADDIAWLSDALNDEQAYLMKSRTLEEKRLALFKGLGIEGKKLSEVIEQSPAEYKAKLKSLAAQLTELVDNITRISAESEELVKRKLDNQREFVKKAGILDKPETYDKKAAKVAGGTPSAKVIRQI